MEDEDNITVADLKATVRVLNVLADNAKQQRAYFKKNAVDDIVDYLEGKIKQIKMDRRS